MFPNAIFDNVDFYLGMHIMYIGVIFLKKKKLAKCMAVIFVIFGIISILFIIIFDKSFAYQLELYSKREVVNTLNREVNNVILEVLAESEISHDNIISVETGIDGKISCVKADMLSVNKLKNMLDTRIASLCECEDSFEAKIPVGNLVGAGLLYGKGFDISVKFRPIGEANTRMTGYLSESGINQTIYRIAFDININAAVVFPFRYNEIPIRIETVVSETVIVGDVPESYTYFKMEGDMSAEDIQGYIEDFKAE